MYKIPGELEVTNYGVQIAVAIPTDITVAKEICLQFILLREQLAEKLVFHFDNGSITITLSESQLPVCKKIDQSKNDIELACPMDRLEGYICHCLQYYQYGFVDTDHWEVDFEIADTAFLSLILKFKDYLVEVRPGDEFEKLYKP